MKKKTRIGENVSSGAEKVERVQKGEAEQIELIEKETKAAENRVLAAQQRAKAQAEKAKRKKDELREGEERVLKEMEERAKRRAERRERRAEAFEKEIATLEREKEEKRIRKAREKQAQSSESGNKKRTPGYGGWLAAVIALGAICLALTAVVTVGAVNMRADSMASAAGYRGTLYELSSIVEKVDDDLDRLRVASSPEMQSKLLTDVLVQTNIAENDLERMPISAEKDEHTMTFLNRTSRLSEMLLEKIESGERLDERDYEVIAKLYEVNHEVRETLDELIATMQDKDVFMMLKGKENMINQAFDKIEDATTLPEPRKPEKPEKNVEPSRGKDQPEGVTITQAEELCKYYFADYNVETLEYSGETMSKSMQTYNFSMTDSEGTRLYAQIEKRTGALLRFDYYKECHDRNVDIETAKNLAAEYLEKFGYEDMIPVRVDESGTNADFTFAYEDEGCVFYPDEVTVKVCEERGIVTGLDASKYLKNHRDRDELNVTLTLGEAQEKLKDNLTVESSRLVVFEHKGREYTAYEFFCSYDGNYYFLYTDANTGAELFIVNSENA